MLPAAYPVKEQETRICSTRRDAISVLMSGELPLLYLRDGYSGGISGIVLWEAGRRYIEYIDSDWNWETLLRPRRSEKRGILQCYNCVRLTEILFRQLFLIYRRSHAELSVY